MLKPEVVVQRLLEAPYSTDFVCEESDRGRRRVGALVIYHDVIDIEGWVLDGWSSDEFL